MWTEPDLRHCAAHGRIEWRRHTLERMLEREISRAEVLATLANGSILTVYPDAKPYPSALVANDGVPPLHIVAALDSATATCYIITVYRPDDAHFHPDLKTRKPR